MDRHAPLARAGLAPTEDDALLAGVKGVVALHVAHADPLAGLGRPVPTVHPGVHKRPNPRVHRKVTVGHRLVPGGRGRRERGGEGWDRDRRRDRGATTVDRDGQHRGGGHVGVVVVHLAVVAVRIGGLALLFLLLFLRLVVGLVALVHLAGVVVVRRSFLRFRVRVILLPRGLHVRLHRPSPARHAHPTPHATRTVVRLLVLAAFVLGLARRQLGFAVRLVRALDKIVQIASSVEIHRAGHFARWCGRTAGRLRPGGAPIRAVVEI